MCGIGKYSAHLFLQRRLTIMGKRLVAYFSAGGTTKKVAEMIANSAKADLFEIEPKIPYTKLTLTGWIKNPEAVWR